MKTLIALLVLSIIMSANATDLTHKFGLGGSFGYPIPIFGNNFNDVANPEWSASIYGRYLFDPTFGLDLNVSKEAFKKTSMNFENINLITSWRTAGAADFTPIVGLGLGVTRIKDYSPKSAKLSLLGRAGIEYALKPALSFGALVDYKYVSKLMGDMPNKPAHILIPQLALTLYFGAEGEKAEKVEQPAVPEKAAQTESDVVSVANAATERNEMQPVITIEFDTSKAHVKSSYNDQIKKVADQLKADNTLAGMIEGYADSTGSEDFNNKLSLRRAEAVRKKLLEFGVDNKQLTTEGFGEGRPVADNSTAEGRQKNRRASVIISIVKSNLSDSM